MAGNVIAQKSLKKRLLEFVELERRAQARDILSKHDLPVEERVALGVCLTDLRFREKTSRELIFAFRENFSKFRTGDWLILNNGHPIGPEIRKGAGVIVSEHDPKDRTITFRVRKSNGNLDLYSKGEYTLDFDYTDFTTERLMSAVTEAFENGNYSGIKKIVEGNGKFNSDTRLAKKAKQIATTLNLTEAQKDAFIDSFSYPLKLIQGPPGTGKTYLLAQIIGGLASLGYRVLLAAFTHRAINNALNMTAQTTGFRDIYKVDGIGSTGDLEKGIEIIHSWKRWAPPAEKCSYVIGATVYRAFDVALSKTWFDMVVFDEAAQLPIPHAIAAMLAGKKYIFIGDHRQMPPIIQAFHSDEEISTSIFQYLCSLYPDLNTMLNTTFRMNKGINEFPSRLFYNGELKPSAEAENRKLQHQRGGELERVVKYPKDVVFIQVNHQDMQQCSPLEAAVVAKLAVELLLIHKVSPLNMAIVAPHRVQVREIFDRLSKEISAKSVPGRVEKEIRENLVVDTVERMQGQERDVMIMSLTASDEDFISSELSFLMLPNRLNVMVTRARKKLFIVGSKYFFRVKPTQEIYLKKVNYFKKYYRYLRERSIDLTSYAEKILASGR